MGKCPDFSWKNTISISTSNHDVLIEILLSVKKECKRFCQNRMTVTVQLDAVTRRADDVSLQNLIFEEDGVEGDINGVQDELDDNVGTPDAITC